MIEFPSLWYNERDANCVKEIRLGEQKTSQLVCLRRIEPLSSYQRRLSVHDVLFWSTSEELHQTLQASLTFPGFIAWYLFQKSRGKRSQSNRKTISTSTANPAEPTIRSHIEWFELRFCAWVLRLMREDLAHSIQTIQLNTQGLRETEELQENRKMGRWDKSTKEKQNRTRTTTRRSKGVVHPFCDSVSPSIRSIQLNTQGRRKAKYRGRGDREKERSGRREDDKRNGGSFHRLRPRIQQWNEKLTAMAVLASPFHPPPPGVPAPLDDDNDDDALRALAPPPLTPTDPPPSPPVFTNWLERQRK